MNFNDYNILRTTLAKTIQDNNYRLTDMEWNLNEISLIDIVEDIITDMEEDFIIKRKQNAL